MKIRKPLPAGWAKFCMVTSVPLFLLGVLVFIFNPGQPGAYLYLLVMMPVTFSVGFTHLRARREMEAAAEADPS